MGKSKDDYKLKRSSPSSPQDEQRRIKKRKTKEDDDKHKSKKHKSHKISKRHSDKDKKSGGKRKDKSRKHDISSIKLNFKELSDDDYFSKNNEFAKWLKEERKTFFSDLSSDSARGLFSEFVAEWNNQELEPQYYEGVTTAPRTSHKWNIKK
ncbi:hypothetical protein ABFS83_13G145500 [Erythranthe nasuta]